MLGDLILKEMNFLAHLVLFPKETDFISGNIAADFLKGSDRKFVSKGVQSGILMHQFVDQFTDTHGLVKTSKVRNQFPYKGPSLTFAKLRSYDHNGLFTTIKKFRWYSFFILVGILFTLNWG